MSANGERRSATWSNSDVWLNLPFMKHYEAHCVASVPAQKEARATPPSDPLQQYHHRQAHNASRCTLAEHLRWADACWREAQNLRVGQTRADLLKSFTTEGGISTVEARRFLHRECDLMHVTITFRLQDGDSMVEDLADEIVKIEGPYLAPYFPG